MLTGYGALAVALNRRLLRDLIAWVVPVIGGIATFFSFMLVAVASPFVTQTRAVDGAGLAPSLQNPYMVAHPPMLYLGYVGLSIPFAFAAGAMLSGQHRRALDRRDAALDARAWMFLGFGQLLGAHWAYVEVGWGGYYAWDPVENAALMPWLAATAFLHSRDGAGAERDAEGLEHGARRARVRALRLRDVPDAVGCRQLDPLVREELDRRLVPRLRRHHVALLARA